MGYRIASLFMACILSPVIATALGAIVFFGDFGPPGPYSFGLIGVAMIGGGLGAIVGIPTMMLLGLPLHAYFQSRGMTGLTPYAIGGAFAGLLASLAFLLWPPAGGDWLSWSNFISRLSSLTSSWEFLTKALVVGVLTGVLAALLFRSLARLHCFAPNPPTSTP